MMDASWFELTKQVFPRWCFIGIAYITFRQVHSNTTIIAPHSRLTSVYHLVESNCLAKCYILSNNYSYTKMLRQLRSLRLDANSRLWVRSNSLSTSADPDICCNPLARDFPAQPSHQDVLRKDLSEPKHDTIDKR